MKSLLQSAAIGALLSGSGAAFAQDIGPSGGSDRLADAGSVDEIVVIGTKQNLTVQEVDVSVEIFDQERLDRESLFELQDVLQRTPNIVSNGSNADVTIRGIGRRGVGGAGGGVTSNVYLDGAPISNGALAFGSESVWDIAQVEVLRGPQSTVQGRNALAGAVVLRTADPTYDWQVKARVRAAEFGTQQFAGVLSGPIIQDQLAFRLAADYQESDGFIDNVIVGRKDDPVSNLMLRAKVVVEPLQLPDLRAEFTVDYNESDASFSRLAATIPANNPDFVNFDPETLQTFGRPNNGQLENTRLLTDITYDLTSELMLQFIGTYEDTDTEESIGSLDTISVVLAGVETDGTKAKTYSSELRLQYDFGQWTGYVGAYYFEDEADRSISVANSILDQAAFILGLDEPINFPLNPSDSIFGLTNDFDSNTRNYAFYAQTRYELNDKWIFDASLRYDNEEVSASGVVTRDRFVDPISCVVTVPGALIGVSQPIVTGPCIDLVELLTPNADTLPQDTSFDAWLPRAAVTYNINDDSSVFVSYQRGYRAGGTFVQQTGGEDGVVVGTFDPEFLDNYEIGFRSEWFDDRLTLNGNVFWSVITDQQVSIPGPSGQGNDFSIENAGRTRLYGAELGGDFQATEGLTFFGSLGLLNAEFRDFPFSDEEGEFQNLAGNEVPNSPTLSFSVGGSYEHVSGLFTDASLSYTGARQSTRNTENLGEEVFGPGVTEELDPLSLLNARIGYRHDNFTFYVFGTNILEDLDPIRKDFGSVNPTTGQVQFVPEPSFTVTRPRTFGVALDVAFE